VNWLMKIREKQDDLLPLRYFVDGNVRDARNLERLKSAWPLLVGPGHGRLTYPISIRNGLLLIGCIDSSKLKSLRASAQGAWPDLRERINRLLKLHLKSIEIVPSDPEPELARIPIRTTENTDPLDAVLHYYLQANSTKSGS